MPSDETYIIDLCDEALGKIACRQARFDFLRGDSRTEKAGRRLPVDAFYADIKLAIEYREKQHSEPVAIMDRRQTLSGCSRGQQRRIYDERRRTELRSHGFELLELDYNMFAYDARKRLSRVREHDLAVIRSKLDTLRHG
jgi:hypothetical protein